MDRNKKPCFKFRSGYCQYGARCKFSHEATPQHRSTEACRHFRMGRCTAGVNCRFSHADNDSGPDNAILQSLQQWRNRVARSINPGHGLAQYFETALRLASMDHEISQEIIVQMTSRPGLKHVETLVEQNFAQMSENELIYTFQTQLLPFFRLASDAQILSSGMLRRMIYPLYGPIFGYDGHAAELLFAQVMRALSALALKNKGLDEVSHDLAVAAEASSAILLSLIEFYSTAKVIPAFKVYAEQLQSIIVTSINKHVDHKLDEAARHVEKILNALGIGDRIPSLSKREPSLAKGKTHVFIVKQNGPGRLFNGQPRHDNDYEDIQDIRILPTADEIQSMHDEYLPLADSSTWHKHGIEGLLDRHFRLLREDTIGQLRSSVKSELEALRAPIRPQGNSLQRNASQTNTYRYARVDYPEFCGPKGLEFLISFEQLPHLRSQNEKQRLKWWNESRRLNVGALVCLIHASGHVTFCIINPRRISYPKKQHAPGYPNDSDATDRRVDPHVAYTLQSDTERAYIPARPVDISKRSLRELLYTFSADDSLGSCSLVEFPGVLLPAFGPTLQAMQSMTRYMDLPLHELLDPCKEWDQDGVDIPLPRYAQGHGFQYSLGSVCKDFQQLMFDPSNFKESDIAMLEQRSTLDHSQASALLHALTRSLSIIQGPPGTGKSFTGVALIKVLLENSENARLGPILCVCYTNHALDQLLEHLLDHDVDQVIRIGAGSKSDRLAALNLREVADKAFKTGLELTKEKTAVARIWEEARNMTQLAKEVCFPHSTVRIQEYLRDTNESHYLELFETTIQTTFDGSNVYIETNTDKNGELRYEYSARPLRSNEKLDRWLNGHYNRQGQPKRSVGELQKARLHTMSQPERHDLHEEWLKRIANDRFRSLLHAKIPYEDEKANLEAVREELNFRVLNEANIIGVTTSGLARHLNLLRRLPSKVMVCEEAGEVLESHLLTAFLPCIEHSILIGDHLQLRPQVQNHNLSVESKEGAIYALDVSLFERLCNDSHLPYSHLDTQRRMHPKISALIRSTLYPSLIDGSPDYPEVFGMKNRLYWLDHSHPECSREAYGSMATSHTNNFEIDMTAALVSYLIKQGEYHAGDIAVLTPYLGQLTKLRERMESSFAIVLSDQDTEDLDRTGGRDLSEQKGQPPTAKASLATTIRMATVDNFQGEEAKVVIISLVRSNHEKQCGFLKTPNRINVLLSRAKHGMYIIGNAKTSSHIPMWSTVIDILSKDGNIGPVLQVQCRRHPDTIIEIRKPNDFAQAPNGGCSLVCEWKLACGHACRENCHSHLLHDNVKCHQPCTRQREGCSHNCKKQCYEPCDRTCNVMLTGLDVVIPCDFQHVKTELTCHLYQHQELLVCTEVVEHTLECGHTAMMKCSDNVESRVCDQQCGAMLDCGHSCQRPCRLCKPKSDGKITTVDHKECSQPCGKPFTGCSHTCQNACHQGQPCELCSEPCTVGCTHSSCDRLCHLPCVPCAELECSSGCPHSQCTMPCAAPCDWVPCSLRCTKLLRCGHQCPSICGAPCPEESLCQQCGPSQVRERVVDLIMFETYANVNLDDSPCIFPSCGHFLTMESMDGHVGIADHYEIDDNGLPCGLKVPEDSLDVNKTKIVCPECRCSLMDVSRYGRVVHRAQLILSTLKFITWSNARYIPLAQRFFDLRHKLQEMPEDATEATIYKDLAALQKQITLFLEKVQESEQPFRRVQDLVNHAHSNRQTSQRFAFHLSVLQTRASILAEALLLRCDLTILSDYAEKRPSVDEAAEFMMKSKAGRKKCEKLLEAAESGGHVQQQIEFQVFWARYAAIELSMRSSEHQESTSASTDLKEEARTRIQHARDLCTRFPGQARAISSEELDNVDKMLRDSVFYAPVTDNEMRAVVNAMAHEFIGTGHWYRCAIGHPFTIGECGGPMEQTTCPQCGAPVGGYAHMAAEGVSPARDLEAGLGAMRIRQ